MCETAVLQVRILIHMYPHHFGKTDFFLFRIRIILESRSEMKQNTSEPSSQKIRIFCFFLLSLHYIFRVTST
jgi:hypothetical protein